MTTKQDEDIPIGKVFYGAQWGTVVLRKFGRCTLKGATDDSKKDLEITNFDQDFQGGGGNLRGDMIESVRFAGKAIIIYLKNDQTITGHTDRWVRYSSIHL